MTDGVLLQMKPEPCSEIIFASELQAAITDGSSIAIGTRYVFPFTLNPVPSPSGRGKMPIQFSIMQSATWGVRPPSLIALVSRVGIIFYNLINVNVFK